MVKIKEDFPIFKSFTKQAHAQNLANGILILRSVNYYRIHIDPNEFTITNKTGIFSLANDPLVFCCHKNQPEGKPHLVRINHSCELFEKIRDTLSPAADQDGVYFGDVKYEDMSLETPGDFDVQQVNFYNEVYTTPEARGIEPAYYKDNKWSPENEVRMCFFVCPERLSAIQDDSRFEIKFYKRYFDCKSMCWEKEATNYQTLKSTRSENRDNWDNSWFEVHLKFEKSNFTLIND